MESMRRSQIFNQKKRATGNWLMLLLLLRNTSQENSQVALLEALCAQMQILSSWFWEFLPESNQRPRDWQSRTVTNQTSF